MTQPRILLRNVEVEGVTLDCRLDTGIVVHLAPSLAPGPGETVIDGDGGALIPGLADHHLHAYACAAARSSVDLTGVDDLGEVSLPPGTGWVRAVGAGRSWRRSDLDEVATERPWRVQHRSGALWTLNSAGVDRLGSRLTSDQRQTGQMWRADEQLRRALDDLGEGAEVDLAGLGRELTSWGITRVTDASPDLDPHALDVLREKLPQQVVSLSRLADDGMPLKIILADHDLPSYDDVVDRVRSARTAGRAVAVHAVSSSALALAIAVLVDQGIYPGDRVEHAAECDDAAAARLAELDVTVVTQPGIWARRSEEFLAETPPYAHHRLWRYRTLLDHGVRVAISSDAPYGCADPWQVIHAAATRPVLPGGRDERVPPSTSLATMLTEAGEPAGRPRTVHVGAPADLVLLRAPMRRVVDDLELSATSPVRQLLVAR